MTGIKAAPVRRPHRSNSALSIVRGITAQKVIYWTAAKLHRLLRGLIKRDREEWFAARVRALKSWPARTKEQIMDDATRINPGPTPDRRIKIRNQWRFVPGAGRWTWPKRELEIQRELLRSAPEDGIDINELRKVLAELPPGAGESLIKLIAESELLKDTTVPLDQVNLDGKHLPQPKEIGTPLLRRIKRLHNKLVANIADDPDGDLARRRGCEVPRANPGSSAGWFADFRHLWDDEGTTGSQVSRKARPD
jgi:hypothetical protein